MNSPFQAFLITTVLSSVGALAADSPPSIPAEHRETAKQAKEQFDCGNYREAEQLYERILAAAPNNLYSLSNLGVVRFRSGELKSAEDALRRATVIAPTDAFSHSTLGIVYYSQGRFDEATKAFIRVLAIDPKNETAKSMLGEAIRQRELRRRGISTAAEQPGLGDFLTPLEKQRLQAPSTSK